MSILSEIQSKLHAPKGQTNAFGKYKYRSCEDILSAVKPLLIEFGVSLIITDEMVLIGDRYYVKASALLEDGKGFTAKAEAYAREPLSKKGMDEAQITGATSSYARKYALNGLLAIDDTKDADSQDNRGYEPISPEPVNTAHVDGCYDMFMETMKADVEIPDFDRMQKGYSRLSSDEKIAVFDKIGTEKIGSTRKGYKALAKELLAMSIADTDNPDNREIIQ